MKITVDRADEEDKLTFTITVSKPIGVNFSEEDLKVLTSVDTFMNTMGKTIDTSGQVYQNLILANHAVKEKILEKVLASLRFHINCVLKKKFEPMCEEIYNWIYDHQEGHVKTWLSSFQPQRVKYYFDNDRHAPSISDDDDEEDSDC